MTGGALCSSCSTRCSAPARSGNCRRCGTRCPRRPAPRRGSASSWRSSRASSRPPSPPRSAKPVARRARVRRVDFRLSRPRRGFGAAATSTFRVAPGEVVAIVGPSGAGKSTLFQLARALLRSARAARSRSTASTSATLDPERACGPRSRSCRRTRSFSARASPTTSPMARRARPARRSSRRRKQAAAHGFIAALPQGYDTQLGERGVTLSGGERQRIAIARAILKDAPVLLLDEATSALDAENETLVQGALETLMKGRTTLVIAHRLATIVNAHRILVIEAGRDRRRGHSRLAARGGRPLRPARPAAIRDRRGGADGGGRGGAVEAPPSPCGRRVGDEGPERRRLAAHGAAGPSPLLSATSPVSKASAKASSSRSRYRPI